MNTVMKHGDETLPDRKHCRIGDTAEESLPKSHHCQGVIIAKESSLPRSHHCQGVIITLGLITLGLWHSSLGPMPGCHVPDARMCKPLRITQPGTARSLAKVSILPGPAVHRVTDSRFMPVDGTGWWVWSGTWSWGTGYMGTWVRVPGRVPVLALALYLYWPWPYTGPVPTLALALVLHWH